MNAYDYSDIEMDYKGELITTLSNLYNSESMLRDGLIEWHKNLNSAERNIKTAYILCYNLIASVMLFLTKGGGMETRGVANSFDGRNVSNGTPRDEDEWVTIESKDSTFVFRDINDASNCLDSILQIMNIQEDKDTDEKQSKQNFAKLKGVLTATREKFTKFKTQIRFDSKELNAYDRTELGYLIFIELKNKLKETFGDKNLFYQMAENLYSVTRINRTGILRNQ